MLGGQPAAERGFVRCALSAPAPASPGPSRTTAISRCTAPAGCARWAGTRASEPDDGQQGAAGCAFITYSVRRAVHGARWRRQGARGARAETSAAASRSTSTSSTPCWSLAMVGLFMWHLDWSRPLVVTPMVNVESALEKESQPRRDADGAGAAGGGAGHRSPTGCVAQAAHGRPSIVVAASGGGTRAAVYTAVALEGMGKIDRAKDVVLLSRRLGRRRLRRGVREPLHDARGATPPSRGVRDGNAWSDYVERRRRAVHPGRARRHRRAAHRGSTSLGALLQESLAAARVQREADARSRTCSPSCAHRR